MSTHVRSFFAAALIAAGSLTPSIVLAQAEPSGPHPRLFLDARTDAAIRALAKKGSSSVAEAVDNCGDIAASPGQFDRDGYMGLDWARSLQTCLIAWKATGNDKHAKTAMRYFRALIDDQQNVGDGLGGDRAAARDSGYAIRAHGPYTALAYDWLHDHPLMDEPTRARARQRFKAWTDWYLAKGYRARGTGTNYHAGYVLAATLIAVAQGSEAGPDGARLWRQVVDTIFKRDLLPGATDGVLVGGDWGEGWQYAPLSLASYSMASRAVAAQGVDVAPMSDWLRDVALRHIYAMTPNGDFTYTVGDTQSETPNLPIRRETLTAVILGPAPLEAKQWAQAELERIGSFGEELNFPIFQVLADAEGVKAQPFPSDRASTSYLSEGTGIVYTRSSWGSAPVWFVAHCSKTIDVDHTPANAGNFVLSRGGDDIIIDPSPYGSLSSVTSNAPSIESLVAPPNYLPSQAFWDKSTKFRWLSSLGGGSVLARCDYAGKYQIQQTPSDIPLAYRDFVLLPYPDGKNQESAVLFVLDRARGKTPAQKLHLRFRTEAKLKAAADGATGSRGSTSFAIRRLASSAGTPEVASQSAGNCFTDNYTRGNCDASRFDITQLKLVVPGPDPMAAHVIEVAPSKGDVSAPKALTASGGNAWLVERGSKRWVVSAASAAGAVSYSAPGGSTHIVLPAAVSGADTMRVASVADAGGCKITVGGGAGKEVPGTPATFAVGPDCAVQALAPSDVPAGAAALSAAK